MSASLGSTCLDSRAKSGIKFERLGCSFSIVIYRFFMRLIADERVGSAEKRVGRLFMCEVSEKGGLSWLSPHRDGRKPISEERDTGADSGFECQRDWWHGQYLFLWWPVLPHGPGV